VVEDGHTADHTGALRAVLGSDVVCTWLDETSSWCFSAGGLVPQAHPTFADALALVRRQLWANAAFWGSAANTDTLNVSRAFMERLTGALCYVR
jgi:hypothetical protein